ncbi:MAG: adenosylmethionine--8-amino-7-oxononanoate transaminase [Bacteroidia bacterium]|nr:adenosylmethionine--8-amino-7-oxononanoate transaminase [Bacteroidia bacterium]MDW8157631.1 adenosylmethionine--8-amino-7-oxononanoate transaminase [Bacteroidia bacterium]
MQVKPATVAYTIWHPYSHMPDLKPIEVTQAKGVYLFTSDNRTIIDAISSWWVNTHGHAHPYIAEAIAKQAQQLEQVIFAGFTHPQAERLVGRLCQRLPPDLNVAFFSDDGSTSVEVAIKMLFQYYHNKKEPKNTIIALSSSYHGDTFGAMSVSARSVFSTAFEPFLFEVEYIEPTALDVLDQLEKKIQQPHVAGLIVEPLVQGVGGMRFYSAYTLDKMIECCHAYQKFVIADEVMTGFGRTGNFFAIDAIEQKPDILCLSKALTGGFLPLGLTFCTPTIYEAFLDSDKTKTFFHGHSYTGNALACAAANAVLDLFEQTPTLEAIHQIHTIHQERLKVLNKYSSIQNPRTIGSIAAFDIAVQQPGYLNEMSTIISKFALAKGVLLRPLGNVVYILPPYVISSTELHYVYDVIEEGLRKEWNL